MKKLDRTLCQEAAKSLELHDIILFESRFERGDISDDEGMGSVQTKRNVRYTRTTRTIEGGELPTLNILVSLGIRVVDNVSSTEDQKCLFMIEADYLVEYRITSDIADEAAKAFASFNGVHNVWPFWRQHVFSISQQGRLPHIEIPLFSG